MTRISLLLALALLSLGLSAQERTIGLVEYDDTVEPGYYLFSPKNGTDTYLINECGERIMTWETDWAPGNIEYLLPNGNLLKAGLVVNTAPLGAGGKGGVFEIHDWEGTILWKYFFTDSLQLAHHEFQIMPNGNILVLAWEYKSEEEAIAAGRDSALIPSRAIWPEKIVEIRPIFPDSAEIVWEWFQWDHLVQDFDPTKDNFGVVADHPELFDINYAPNPINDWIHANALDYDPVQDQIILCSRNQNEFYIIDHSTTTEEAAGSTGGRWGKGGDILFRFGNPEAYDQGDTSDQVLFDPHNPNWIDEGLTHAGDIVVFNNGRFRPAGNFSDVLRLVPTRDPVDTSYVLVDGKFAVDTLITIYKADPPTDFYAPLLSGVQALGDDHYMISDGPAGTAFEIDPAGEIYWKYIIPYGTDGPLEQGYNIPPGNPTQENLTFRFRKYPPDFPGFVGKDLDPKGFIELNALPSLCDEDSVTTGIDPSEIGRMLSIYPNPVHAGQTIAVVHPKADLRSIALIDLTGRIITQWPAAPPGTTTIQLPTALPAGIYTLRFEPQQHRSERPIYQKLSIY